MRKIEGGQNGGGWYCLQYFSEMIYSLVLQRHTLDFWGFFTVCFLTCDSVKLLYRAQASILLNAVFCANG